MVELFMLEYLTALGFTMVLLLMAKRHSLRRTLLAGYSVMALVMLVVAGAYKVLGLGFVTRYYFVIAHVPSVAFLLVFSQFRGWRMLFQMMTAILFCLIVQHATGIVYYLTDNNTAALIITYIALTAFSIWLIIRQLRPLFIRALTQLRRGWWQSCLVIAGYYMIIAYLIPGYAGFDVKSTYLKLATSLLMAGFYWIIMLLLNSAREEADARQRAQLNALQLNALQSRMDAVRAAERAIRTERHDLCHRLQTVAELVARGDRDDALRFLDAAQRRLDERKELRWCRPPVLDAVCASYFDQARNLDIAIRANINLPDELPVDESELAIVLANALDNAIHANQALPEPQREIRCRMACTPTLMLRVSNPCAGEVKFDERGLPVAQQSGHGLGTQSVCAFCQKYGAVCAFRQADGWFHMQVIL